MHTRPSRVRVIRRADYTKMKNVLVELSPKKRLQRWFNAITKMAMEYEYQVSEAIVAAVKAKKRIVRLCFWVNRYPLDSDVLFNNVWGGSRARWHALVQKRGVELCGVTFSLNHGGNPLNVFKKGDVPLQIELELSVGVPQAPDGGCLVFDSRA